MASREYIDSSVNRNGLVGGSADGFRLTVASTLRRAGGRTWWAHLTLTRMNISPIVIRNQIEARLDVVESAHSAVK